MILMFKKKKIFYKKRKLLIIVSIDNNLVWDVGIKSINIKSMKKILSCNYFYKYFFNFFTLLSFTIWILITKSKIYLKQWRMSIP